MFFETKNFYEIIQDYHDELNRIASPNDTSRIQSGFDKLDTLTNGFQPASITLIGGVLGMGKTLFASTLVKKMTLEKNQFTLFFSLHYSSEQFINSILCQETGIDYSKLCRGELNESERDVINSKLDNIKKAPLEFYDYPFLTIADIEFVLECRPSDCLPKIIVIDSLRSIAKNKKDKTGKLLNKREITKIMFQLKKLARKYNVAILITSEIQKKRKNTSFKTPTLKNVYDYAPITNYADLILLLYRPEYYGIETWESDKTSAIGEGEIIVAKINNDFTCDNSIRIKFNTSKYEVESL
jgi:replicative DNA helicase